MNAWQGYLPVHPFAHPKHSSPKLLAYYLGYYYYYHYYYFRLLKEIEIK
jgi:hypothetical protein